MTGTFFRDGLSSPAENDEARQTFTIPNECQAGF